MFWISLQFMCAYHADLFHKVNLKQGPQVSKHILQCWAQNINLLTKYWVPFTLNWYNYELTAHTTDNKHPNEWQLAYFSVCGWRGPDECHQGFQLCDQGTHHIHRHPLIEGWKLVRRKSGMQAPHPVLVLLTVLVLP